MITLSEHGEYKWKIKYCETAHAGIDLEVTQYKTLIKGDFFDFIPRLHETIVIDGNIYMVYHILYNWDAGEIQIYLNLLREYTDKTTND